MAEEVAVRSERPSLDSLTEALSAVNGSKDTDELAHLLLLSAEIYADARCRCEEKEVTYGEGDEETVACDQGVGRARQELLKTYREVIDKLKGRG